MQNSVASHAKVLRMKDLVSTCGLSRSTIYDKMDSKSRRYDPSFPKPLKLGLSAIGWIEQDILCWLESKKVQS